MIKLLGVPYDEHSSYLRGAAGGPPLIREAFFCPSANAWTELGVDLGLQGIMTDYGDMNISDGPGVIDQIEKAARDLSGSGDPVIFLGGDHAITYPLVKGITRHYSRINILHIDSHPDLYDSFEGDKFSHASPFARIMEEGLVKRLVQVGVHTMNNHCRDQARRFGVEVIEMKDFKDDWTPNFDGPLYLSFDIDGIDPAFAPGVSHREPGGLTIRQVFRIIHQIKNPLVGADIVEFNPKMDVSGLTAMLSARILKEIAGKMILLNHKEK